MKTGVLLKKLEEIYGDNGLKKGVFAAPGRVNLIGGHTDYNGGFVLPAAIDRKIIIAAQLRKDRSVFATALDFDQTVSFSVDRLSPLSDKKWANYLQGAASELQRAGYLIHGLNLVFCGNIPIASGLSSSAALEVAAALAFSRLNSLEIELLEIARLCQKAENNFVGVDCGVMDQYISCLGKKDHLLFINCRKDFFELIPFRSELFRLVICDSQISRTLLDSEYNKRRDECKEAVALLNKYTPCSIETLGEVSWEQFKDYKSVLKEPYNKRARHVILENERVKEAVKVLKENDFKTLGRLMAASHRSLRDDYEVSCKELDFLVKIALNHRGVLGSRMTGAGFGGCTVNLVHKDFISLFKETISFEYKNEFGEMPEIYVSRTAEGARKL